MIGTLIGNHKWQINMSVLMTLSDPSSGFKIYLQVECLKRCVLGTKLL